MMFLAEIRSRILPHIGDSMNYTAKSVWKKVRQGAVDECWPWNGYLSSGRGRLDINGVKGVYAHRAAFIAANPNVDLPLREDDSDRYVCHSCDNPICCNPGHLYLGTHQQNMDDKVARGRSKIWSHSTKSPRAKLTVEDVKWIRIQKNYATKKALALLYDVSEATISGCLYGRHYQDI